MNKYLKILLIVFLFNLNHINLLSQNLKGKIINEKGNPLEFANIMAYSLPDTILVNGTVSNSNGEFILKIKEEKKYIFKITSVGYYNKWLKINELKLIKLKEIPLNISEAKVIAHKLIFKQDKSNIVCNIENSILNKETDIIDLLGKLPGLYVKNNEVCTISKGRLIYYLNGKPASLKEIKHLNISLIKNIKIDNHPGAGYSGDVSALINIYTKNKLEGVALELSYKPKLRHKLCNYIDFNAQITHKKLCVNFGGSLDFTNKINNNIYNLEKNENSEKWILNTSFNSPSYSSDKYFNLGLNYTFNPNHNIALSYYYTPSNSTHYYENKLYNLDKGIENRDNIKNNTEEKEETHNINITYRNKINNKLSIGLISDFYTSYSTNNQENREKDRVVHLKNINNNKIFGVSPFMSYTPYNEHSFNFGIDFSNSQIQKKINININDINNSNNIINKNILAPYTSYHFNYKRFSFSLGLRYEITDTKYINLHENKTTSYFNKILLPTIKLNYTGKIGQSFAYSTTTNRPSYNQLEGNTDYANKYMYKTGNPNLRYELNHNFSYTIIYKFIYFLTEYSISKNNISDAFYLENINGVDKIRITNVNLKKTNLLKFMLNLSPSLGIYHPNLTIGYIKNWANIPMTENETYFISKPFMIVRFNNTLVFKNNWLLELGAGYNGSGNQGYFNFSSTSNINFSLQKGFSNNHLIFKINGYDIFNKSNPYFNGNIYGIKLSGYNDNDIRFFGMSIIWRFNNFKQIQKQSSISSEINRL